MVLFLLTVTSALLAAHLGYLLFHLGETPFRDEKELVAHVDANQDVLRKLLFSSFWMDVVIHQKTAIFSMKSLPV